MNGRTQASLAQTLRGLRLHPRKKPERRPRDPLPVLIAYGDVPSARQALARITDMLRKTEPGVELHPMLWRFNQLDDPRWRDVALADAARAKAVVLAMSHESAFCARTQSWMTTLLGQLHGRSLTVLALIGEQEAWTVTLAQPRAEEKSERNVSQQPDATEVFASVVPKRLSACAA